MDQVTLLASGFLIRGGLLIGMPVLLLGFFLVLGLKLVNKVTVVFTAIGVFFFGALLFGIALDGIATGAALKLGKASGLVLRANSPIHFWVTTACAVTLAASVAGLGCWMTIRALNGRLTNRSMHDRV